MNTTIRKKIFVIIPCYNEEGGVRQVIKSFPRERIEHHGFDLEILVVDNNSTDRTAEVARALGATVIHEPKKGKGNAMRTGFWSVPDDADYVVMLDGDNTYRPEEILRLVELLDSDFASVVIGSRLGGRIHDESMSFTSRVGNWIFSHLVRYFFNVNVTDVLTGYFAWKLDALKRLRPHLESFGFAIEMEMVTKMARLGEDIYCAPISYHSRHGQSNLRPFYDGSRILTTMFKNLYWSPKPDPKTLAEAAFSGKGAKKRIVIVSSYYPPHVGGLEIVAHSQAKLLAAAGNTVTVITSRVKSNRSVYFENGVRVIRVRAFNFFERWGVPFPLFWLNFITASRREIRHADVVHVHDAFYMSSVIAAYWAHWYKKPLVLTQHVAMIPHTSALVMGVQHIVYKTSGRLVLRWSDAIISLNDRVHDFLVAQGVPPQKVRALQNGVDSILFHPVDRETKLEMRRKYGLSLDKKIILFVGRFVPKKGFHKLLAAKSSKYQIVFVGGTSNHESTDEVVFLGTMPQSTLAEVYQAADLFALPSEGEGFPLSVQEAMATGLPVITSDDYGYTRYNFDRNRMHFISEPTEENIRKIIHEIIHDDVLLGRMSEYSQSYATEHFDWHKIIARLEDIYDAVKI